MLVFLDLEASALVGGFPVEVGWIRHSDNVTYSTLVRPTEEWLSHFNWDATAEALTGISRSELAIKGRDRSEVAADLVRDLAGHRVVVDGGASDRAWLDMLTSPEIVPLEDFDGLLAAAADRGGWQNQGGAVALERAIAEATRGLPFHRALDDARTLLFSFEIALAGPKNGV